MAVNGLLRTEDHARAVFRQWRPARLEGLLRAVRPEAGPFV
ncbi:hypothetical protein [Streptomyces sp. NBC_01754]